MADERDRLRRLRALETEQAANVVTPTPSVANDPYYIRDPKTGLSPAQMEARQGLEAAQAALKDVGIESKLLTSKTQAGRLAPKPADVPSDANYNYTWKFMPEPGNLLGGNWELVRTPRSGVSTGATGPNGSTGPTGPGATGPTGPTGPGRTFTASDGTVFTDQNAFALYEQNLRNQKLAADAAAAEAKAGRQSAFDLLLQQFSQYGMGGLVEPLRGLIESDISAAEFTLRLRDTDAYKKRFAANQQRINRGLRALSEAEYIGLEDQYQDVMRRYGLPDTYYTRGDMGRQEGFEKFIGGDVSPVELEDRIQTAQNRVINAAPQISQALREYYPDITNGDILAYVLDPDKALSNIKRLVQASEIGGAARIAGLGATRARAEELGRFGVTGEQARQGFSTIAEFLPSAQKLSDIYGKQGLGPYTQEVAEQEVFGITGAAESGRKRRKLAELETASFSGQAGVAGGALARERAGQY